MKSLEHYKVFCGADIQYGNTVFWRCHHSWFNSFLCASRWWAKKPEAFIWNSCQPQPLRFPLHALTSASRFRSMVFHCGLFCRKTLAAFVINSNSKPCVSETLFNNASLANDFTNKTGIDEFQVRPGTARSTRQYWTPHWRMENSLRL